MASVTVLTAAATRAILNQTIKDVEVLEDGRLRFTRWDDSTFTTTDSVMGPEGPEGPEGPVSEADLTALKNDTGYGVVGHDDVDTEQIWGFDEDGWHEITGVTVTFNQTAGRRYRICWSILMSSGADDVKFDTEVRDGATVMARGDGYAPDNGRATNAGGVMEYTAGTTSSKTFKIHARGNTPNDIHVQSDYVKTFLSVEDIGVV